MQHGGFLKIRGPKLFKVVTTRAKYANLQFTKPVKNAITKREFYTLEEFFNNGIKLNVWWETIFKVLIVLIHVM